MTTSDAHRAVTLRRTSAGRYAATNARGGELTFGSGDDNDFTPVELLLAAIGGCSAIDVDILTSRRAEPTRFEVVVGADKARDEAGANHLEDVEVNFRVTFGDGDGGDAARTLLPMAMQKSHDRLCTVSRTVEMPTPVAFRLEP